MENSIKNTCLIFLSCTFLFSCSSINKPSVTQLSSNPPLYMVSHPLRYITDDGKHKIIVPAGFITDLASIPSVLWWWESPHETTLAPAILHDYLYWQQTCTKDESDAVMYLAMKKLELSFTKRELIYAGIRTPFALSAWNKNNVARMGGESRFFTKEYSYYIMDSELISDVTLTSIQQAATSKNGMFSPPQDDHMLKAACEAALIDYKS
jgi:hypothetical protein